MLDSSKRNCPHCKKQTRHRSIPAPVGHPRVNFLRWRVLASFATKRSVDRMMKRQKTKLHRAVCGSGALGLAIAGTVMVAPQAHAVTCSYSLYVSYSSCLLYTSPSP